MTSHKPLKVILFGGHHFGRTVADWLYSKHELLAVSTQPGRLYQWAVKHHVPLLPEAGAIVAPHLPECDLIVCAHCHDFIPAEIRARAKHGAIGYHPSLLPAYRGRNAIADALRDQCTETGGSIYKLDDGWDTGIVLHQAAVPILQDETPSQLWQNKLAPLGLSLFRKALHSFQQDAVSPPVGGSASTPGGDTRSQDQ